MRKTEDRIFIRLDKTLKRDRQMDRQTDRIGLAITARPSNSDVL